MTQKKAGIAVFLLAQISWLCLPQASNAQTPTNKPWLMKPNYTRTCRHAQLTAKQIADEYKNASAYPIVTKIPKDFKILPNRRKFTLIWGQDEVLVPVYLEHGRTGGYSHDFQATAICEIEDTKNTYWLVTSNYDGSLSYFYASNVTYLR